MTHNLFRPLKGVTKSFTAVAIVLAAACSENTGSVPTAQSPTVPCRFKLDSSQHEGQTVKCGDLPVPSYRGREGNTQLHFAIFKSDLAKSNPIPLVEILGGPGQSWHDIATKMTHDYVRSMGSDIIIVEQRGVRDAVPNLECDAAKTEPSNPEEAKKTIQACITELQQKGAVLEGVTGWDMAEDIEALRQSLNIPKFNLLGTSYGTRIALHFVRNHPERVVGAVLDSSYPPEVLPNSKHLADRFTIRTTLFQACRQDPQCASVYPDLQKLFFATLTHLERTPLTIQNSKEVFDHHAFFELTHFIQMAAPSVVPAFIGLLDAWIAQYQTTGVPEDIAKAISATSSKMNDGLGITGIQNMVTNCADWEGTYSQVDQSTAMQKVSVELQALAKEQVQSEEEKCTQWPHNKERPEVALQPVSEPKVPVLLLSGELDVATPPVWAAHATGSLGKAQHIVIPGAGHSVVGNDQSGCAKTIVGQFLNSPGETLNTACVQAIKSRFLTDPKTLIELLKAQNQGG